jgi:dsRNA-specific ribonuclease
MIKFLKSFFTKSTPIQLAPPQERKRNKRQRKTLESGRAEWYGDAILKFYTVKYLMETFPGLWSRDLADPGIMIITNKNLNNYAKHKNFNFGAPGVEKLIAKIYQESPEKAYSMVKEIADFSGEIAKLKKR